MEHEISHLKKMNIEQDELMMLQFLDGCFWISRYIVIRSYIILRSINYQMIILFSLAII